VLALVALILFLPGRFRLPAIDRDESRYMQATSQMLETHDFIDVRFQDRPRYLQPAGIYWLEALSVAAFSEPAAREPWAYRIPSLFGAVAAVLLTGWIGSTLFGASAGMAAALLLATSLLMGVEARMAKIDATLLAAILVAQASLLRIYLDAAAGVVTRRRWAALHWIALGVGLMLKGPLILLVSWGTILGLVASERRTAWLQGLHAKWGIPLMLAIVLPWCVAIGVASGGDFFSKSVGDNFLGKVAQGQQAHGFPPGYYLSVFAASFWPGSLFAVLALPFVWTRRRRPEVRFLLAWIIPTWLLFELVATKLPHYVLPTYPAIACLAAAAVLAPGAWQFGRTWRWIGRVYGAIWLLIGVALAVAGPVLLWVLQGQVNALPILASLAGTALIGLSAWAAWRLQPRPAIVLAGGAALVLFASAYALVLPDLTTIWLSPRIAAAVAAVRPCPDSVLASASYSEPSLVFAVGRETRLVNAAAAADYLAGHQTCGLALIGTREDTAFQARLEVLGIATRALAEVKGLNYSTGSRLDLTIYGAEPP